MLDAQVVVLAKRPEAGRTKTRLCPPLSLGQAAEVARAALLDTLDTVAGLAVRRRVVVLDGAPDGLVGPGFDVRPQRGGGLDARLAAAVTESFLECQAPLLLIGMDTPQVTAALLRDALDVLLTGRPVLGPAEDGGWWAIGLHAPDPHTFLGVAMSTDRTGVDQEARMRERGLDPLLLPPLRDIDVVDDLLAVSAMMPPGSRLATLTRELGFGTVAAART